MKVTGIAIQVALQQQNSKVKTLETKFEANIKVFDHEGTPNLEGIAADIEKARIIAAELRSLLLRYNLQNVIEFEGRKVLLADALSLVSIYSITQTTWKKTLEKEDRYGSEQRSADTKYRDHVLSFDQREDLRQKAEKRAAEIRAAVQIANARTLDIDYPIISEAAAILKV